MPPVPPSILVVEDDRETRALIAKYLRNNSCNVTTVNDGVHSGAQIYNDAVELQIDAVLTSTFRFPALSGGDITFQGYRDGVVFLHMRGACSGCPSSTATLRHGIENLLKHFIPEVQEVRPV